MNELINTQLGQYQLVEAIGHGGMSTVYKAYQASLDRFVAVKVLLSTRDPQFAARFQREAHTIARLQHPNMLPIHDYGEQDGVLYFVLQYVEGGITLNHLCGNPIEPRMALQLIGQVLSVLDYAHSYGIVHRDIKPANILLPTPTWPMLADFGIAKLMHESQQLTMSGFIIGTAAYMSPEQASGGPIDGRTDLYALGVVLYEMLTGRLPFNADTPMAMLTKHVYEAPPPPCSINPSIHPVVEQVLLRALEKDPNARYQNAAEMAAGLELALTALGQAATPSQATSIYQSGLAAFQAGRWSEAIDRFNQLVALDPTYEDATSLLEIARQAQAGTAGGTPAPGPSIAQPDALAAAPESRGVIPPAAPANTLTTYNTRVLHGVTDLRNHNRTTITTQPIECPQCGALNQLRAQACVGCGAQFHPAGLSSTRPSTAASLTGLRSLAGTIAQPGRARWVVAAVVILLISGAGNSWWRRTHPVFAIGEATPAPTLTLVPSPTPALPTATAIANPTAMAPAPAAPAPAVPAAAPNPPAPKPPKGKPPKTKPPKGKK